MKISSYYYWLLFNFHLICGWRILRSNVCIIRVRGKEYFTTFSRRRLSARYCQARERPTVPLPPLTDSPSTNTLTLFPLVRPISVGLSSKKLLYEFTHTHRVLLYTQFYSSSTSPYTYTVCDDSARTLLLSTFAHFTAAIYEVCKKKKRKNLQWFVDEGMNLYRS